MFNAESVFGYELNSNKWPVFRLEASTLTKWKELVQKIKDDTFSEADLADCDLKTLYSTLRDEAEDNIDVKVYFSGLRDLGSINRSKCIYAIIDMKNVSDVPKFFENKESVQKYFIETYCKEGIEWLQMDKKTFDSVTSIEKEPFPIDILESNGQE